MVGAVDGGSVISSNVESGKFCSTADAEITDTVVVGANVIALLFPKADAF